MLDTWVIMAAWSSGLVGNVGWSPIRGNDLLKTGSNQGGLLTVVNEPYNSGCSLRQGAMSDFLLE
jgi:hypothetical protein